MNELAPRPSQQDVPLRGLVSLSWMINFKLGDFLLAYRLLVQDRDLARNNAADYPIQEDSDFARNLKWVHGVLGQLQSESLRVRLKSAISSISQNKMTAREYLHELSEIIRAIEDEAARESLFLYEPDDALRLKGVGREWRHIFIHFPSVQNDIVAAIDCFALGHHTACIFYLMRCAEIGLRSLARERGVVLKKDKPVDYANWQEVITEIQKKIKVIGETMRAGPGKDHALEFYNNAVLRLNYLKDVYRNQTMHVRYEFGPKQARDALEQTFQLMDGFGDLLYDAGEEGEEPIDWKSFTYS